VGCHLLISAGRLQNDLIWAPSWWALSIKYPRSQADLAAAAASDHHECEQHSRA